MLLAVMMVVSVVPMMASADEAEEHVHDWGTWNTFDGQCNRGCYTCGAIERKAHSFSGNTCTTCGYTKPCDHVGVASTYTSNGNGTHAVTCGGCGAVLNSSAACVTESGACACGYKAPECDHGAHTADWKYVSNGNNTHAMICSCGANVGTADCVPGCVCGGYKAPECDHWAHTGDWTATSNGNNTHTNTCVCGDVVNTVACVPGCLCGGYVEDQCDHVGAQTTVDNKDGKTHKVVCPKCDAVITPAAAHVFSATTGKCDCGAVKAAAGTTTPGTGNAGTAAPATGLDSVPKTGDTIGIALTGMLVISVLGSAAYLFALKKKVI